MMGNLRLLLMMIEIKQILHPLRHLRNQRYLRKERKPRHLSKEQQHFLQAMKTAKSRREAATTMKATRLVAASATWSLH